MAGDVAVDCVCGLISVAWLLLGLGLCGRKIYSVGVLWLWGSVLVALCGRNIYSVCVWAGVRWLGFCGYVVVAGLLNHSVLVRGVIM